MEMLARRLLETAAIHERSWDGAKRSYKVSINAAVQLVSTDSLEQRLLSLLLHVAWNDSQDWANDLLERENGP